jgi:hypothetical protein
MIPLGAGWHSQRYGSQEHHEYGDLSMCEHPLETPPVQGSRSDQGVEFQKLGACEMCRAKEDFCGYPMDSSNTPHSRAYTRIKLKILKVEVSV